MRTVGLLIAIMLLVADFAAAEEIVKKIHTLPLSAARLDVVSHARGESKWVFCNLHDDENTSVEAALQLMQQQPGRLIEIRHSGKRNCEFQLGETTYLVDPNRIFTPLGIRKTLTDLSQWSEEAQAATEAFSAALLKLYDLNSYRLVIALHNNSEARYSAVSYLPNHEYATEAADVFINADLDTDDFFFVTDRRIFDELKQRRLNVVLQNNAGATDDGSLSVYCGKQGIPYVNVEAQHGHLDQQLAMLQTLLMLADNPQLGILNPEMINLNSLNAGFVIEARYATTNNITGKRLYPANELYLAKDAADRLVRVQNYLSKQGLGLKVFDAYRPLSVQKRLWEVKPDERYVANPEKGSRHNRGYAVDVTLVDSQGQELAMPTEFDEFNEQAHLDYNDLSEEVLRNRATLQAAMKREQFEPLATEWWHFDAPGWQAQPVMDENPYSQPLFPE